MISIHSSFGFIALVFRFVMTRQITLKEVQTEVNMLTVFSCDRTGKII